VSTLAGMGAVVRRDLRIAASYRLRFLTQLLTAAFTLTLFFYISRLVHVDAFGSPDAYYAFAVVGLIALQLLNAILQTPPTALRQELVAGTFERVVTSPLGPVGASLAMMVFPFLSALVTAMVMLVFAGVAFGVPVEWGTLALAVPIAAAAAMSFAAFGVLLLAVVLVAKQAVAGATFVVAGISLVAGLYFPVELLPGWIGWASEVQPFTPAVDLLRWAVVGRPLDDPALLDLARLAGAAVVLLPLSVLALERGVRAGRRRGTIIEY
jgi:ABC-2 type transport system permease protein